MSPPGTIITSVVLLGGVDSDPKYGHVQGGGRRRPSSELLDLAVKVAGASRPSLLSSSDALLGLCKGVFGSPVDDGRLLSWSMDDGELDDTLSDPGVSMPPLSDIFVLSTRDLISKIKQETCPSPRTKVRGEEHVSWNKTKGATKKHDHLSNRLCSLSKR